jgi:hypothetical protein
VVGSRAGGWQEKKLATGIQVGQVVLDQVRSASGREKNLRARSCFDWAKAQEAAGWLTGWLAGQGTRHEAIDDLSKVQRVRTTEESNAAH